jgi:dTDP-D-glucose 4,6-dehydratase
MDRASYDARCAIGSTKILRETVNWYLENKNWWKPKGQPPLGSSGGDVDKSKWFFA